MQTSVAAVGLIVALGCRIAGAITDPPLGTLGGQERPRIIVVTDISYEGDPDDRTALGMFLLTCNQFDVEGLISALDGGAVHKDVILDAVDAYAKDYPNLASWEPHYPDPDYLRQMTKNGNLQRGTSGSSEASKRIIEAAKKDNPRRLHVIIWA